MRSESSEVWAPAGAEVNVASVEKDLTDVVALEDFEAVRNIKGLIVDSRLPFKRVAVDENKRVWRQAHLGNLRVRWWEMVGVVKRCSNESLGFLIKVLRQTSLLKSFFYNCHILLHIQQ